MPLGELLRLIFLTFFGKARWAGSEHIQHAVHHVHEDAGEVEGDHDSAAEHAVRVKEGTAASAQAKAYGAIARPLGELGWTQVEKILERN